MTTIEYLNKTTIRIPITWVENRHIYPNVSNDESKLISTFAVVLSGWNALILNSDRIEFFLLDGHFPRRALHDDGGHANLLHVQPLQTGQIEVLDAVGDESERARRGTQSLAELELLVVH